MAIILIHSLIAHERMDRYQLQTKSTGMSVRVYVYATFVYVRVCVCVCVCVCVRVCVCTVYITDFIVEYTGVVSVALSSYS